MGDEVKPEVIKKTQELLGKYFKSPPLTDKLLRKPPFRFLHDIISAVIRETGFLQGLYSEEELNSDNVKDKESKVAYLTKLIEVIKIATGDSLTVRPSKIVSGQEPTKTNELLQSIGRALDKKVNSRDAIEQYKKHKSKSKSDKDESKKVSKKTSQKKQTENGNAKDVKIPSPEVDKDKENEHADNAHEVESNGKEVKNSGNHNVQQKVERQPSSKVKKSGISSKPETETALKSSKSVRKKSIPETPESAKKPRVTRESDAAKKKKPIKMQSSDSIPENEVVETKTVQNLVEDEKPNHSPNLEKMENVNEPANEPEKTEEGALTENAVNKKSEVIKAVEISAPVVENARPRTSLRPPSARPPSARPAAPKMRAKTDFIINEEIVSSTGNVNLIVENFDTKEDNADDMVVMEAPRDPLQLQSLDKMDTQFSQEHGHLVAQILETQKELINTDSADVLPKKEWEAGSRRDRETTVKEVDKLRSTIQTLTRTTNPLRKLLDFVQEDVEIMQKELKDWQLQYEEFSKELDIEKTKTEQSIDPMKESLDELKKNIKQQLSKIGQVKMNIMKNDQKIHRLLNGNF